MPTVESRLTIVERQLRLYRAMTLGLLVALAALVGYGAAEGVPEVIQARRFEIVAEGLPRVTISSAGIVVGPPKQPLARIGANFTAGRPAGEIVVYDQRNGEMSATATLGVESFGEGAEFKTWPALRIGGKSLILDTNGNLSLCSIRHVGYQLTGPNMRCDDFLLQPRAPPASK